MVALTQQQELVCVSQYRPAVDAVTLELPAGLLEVGEDPLQCAVRELAEEANFQPSAAPIPLGCLLADTGRLENRFWAFVATGVVPIADNVSEPDVTCRLVPLSDMLQFIADGRFAHALHIAAIGLAIMRGALPNWSENGPRRMGQQLVGGAV
jgi:ADP-ribose pyrophosphatase